MKFKTLLSWMEQRLDVLEPPRRRHVRRLCRILVEADCWEAARWHDVARKIADAAGEQAPEMPERRASSQDKRHARMMAAAPPQPPPARREEVEPRRRRFVRPPGESIQMNPQLEAAFDAVASGKPILFVTGGAGTGKSTFIRALRDRFADRSSVVLAPTGVAALTAGGQTIHSFCGLPLRPVLPEDIRKDEEARKLLESLDLVIVDEISMVRADVLDGLERFLRIHRRPETAFGGVQMVFVGDLFQLPPVVRREDDAFLAQRYETPWFFSAGCLKGLTFKPVELQINYRQADGRFKELLRQIRDGREVANALAEINRLCVGRPIHGHHVTLVPTRKAAAAENEKQLAALPSREWAYAAMASGSFSRRSEDSLPAPARLVLKRGAQVMFVRNDPQMRWVNGTIGTVKDPEEAIILVRLDSGEVHEVEPVEWTDIEYAYDEKEKKVVEEIAGAFVQFPLMPAWAVTIHKAQGLTLSRAAVDLGKGAFAEGQVYVALSRCRSVEGLSLTRPIRPREVLCSEPAKAFYAKMARHHGERR